MPIRPENKALYPKDWKAISLEVRERAGWCCEGLEPYPDCRGLTKCECGSYIWVGQRVIRSVDTGVLHFDCCGPEPEGFVDENDEPLKPGDPIPTGWIWTEEDDQP